MTGLRLDHATLQVPDFTETADILWERFGLRLTPTSADPEAHGRIYLDRGYVEVVPRPGEDELRLTGFYLSYPDVPSAIETLRGRGLASMPATPYRGVDGDWWDGVLAPPDGVPAPILVQRTAPAAVAADWPPPLRDGHPSGIERLVGVYLVTPYVAEAVDFYARLVRALTPAAAHQAAPERVAAGGHPWALADQHWEAALPGGGRVLICDPLRPGRARDMLLTGGPGLVGLELATRNLPDTESRLEMGGVGHHLEPDERGLALWIDPAATPGIAVVIRSGWE
jgi:hypothetical protein